MGPWLVLKHWRDIDVLLGPDGETLQCRKGVVQHREVGALLLAGTPALLVPEMKWIEQASAWWAENAAQVETKDHPASGPWPDKEAYVPSVWFGTNGNVLVFEVIC